MRSRCDEQKRAEAQKNKRALDGFGATRVTAAFALVKPLAWLEFFTANNMGVAGGRQKHATGTSRRM